MGNWQSHEFFGGGPAVRHVEGASKRDTRGIPFWGPESMASCPSLDSSVV